jgi:hypothetical protein
MERTDLIVWEAAKRLRAGRRSRHMPEGEIRRLPDDGMLCNWTALMRFEIFATIISIHSNAAELRMQSRHVAGVPMENGSTMTSREGAINPPHSIEGCDQSQGGTPRTLTARGPAIADFKDGSPTEHQRIA